MRFAYDVDTENAVVRKRRGHRAPENEGRSWYWSGQLGRDDPREHVGAVDTSGRGAEGDLLGTQHDRGGALAIGRHLTRPSAQSATPPERAASRMIASPRNSAVTGSAGAR
jgi:hypothetical protein